MMLCSVSPFLRTEAGQQEQVGSHLGPQEGLGSQKIQLTRTKHSGKYMSDTSNNSATE